MNDELKCFFKGECYKNHYDYYILLDGSLVKADYCYKGMPYERSYCSVEGKKFYGVRYSEEFSYKTPYKTTSIFSIMILTIIFWIVCMIVKVIWEVKVKSNE